MRTPTLALAAVFFVSWTPAAHAATQCFSSTDEFNTFMDAQTAQAATVTLSYTVTGVNLDDYLNGKGWLSEFADTRCAGNGLASLKVYGNSSPLNTAHPPGTLKLEYGSYCCAAPPCPIEYWADPNPGDPIFSQPSQICDVTESLTPTTLSYDVQCDGGTLYHAEGGNHDAMQIDRAAVLSEVTGGHAMTNASVSNVSICFELGGPPVGSQNVPVMEDVTVAPQSPSSVYPDVNDLACGAGDGTTYLKFDLSSLSGQVTSAKLFVHSATDSSSAGTGADVDAVADTSWSESTLTWNVRPALGQKLGRIDGVSPDLWYSADVTSAFSGPAVYGFALAPSATDTDTAHFMSKEASATLKAYLLLNVLDGVGGTTGSGGTAGSGATTGTGGASGGGGWTNNPIGGSGGNVGTKGGTDDASSDSGCTLAHHVPDSNRALLWLAALALLGVRRRR
jgi:MYXO-CTERM domain-containing protein